MTTPAPRFANDDDAAQHWLMLLRDGDADQKITAREQLAAVFERRGMYEEAAELLVSNVRDGVRNADIFRWLARLYRAQGDEGTAMQAAAEAAKYLPSVHEPPATQVMPVVQQAAPTPVYVVRKPESALAGCFKVILVTGAIIAGGFVLLLLIGTVFSAVSGPSGPRPQDPGDAKIVCRRWVREALRAPSTAVFPSYADETAVKNADATVTVRSYVDAQNGFGAQIRTRYTCIARPTGGDNWTLVSLDM